MAPFTSSRPIVAAALLLTLGACLAPVEDLPLTPLEDELLAEMRCDATPIPGDYFGMLEVQRRIDPKTITHEAGLACAAIPGGLALNGMRFERICGNETDPDRRRRAGYFGKAATAPQTLRLETSQPAPELQDWARRQLRLAKATGFVKPRLDGGPGSALECVGSPNRK